MKIHELVITAMAAFAGAACVTAVLNSSEVQAGESGEKNVIQANAFEVIDADGKVRARLGTDDKGAPNLWLMTSDGTAHAQMANMENVVLLRAAIKELQARKEHDAKEVKVQHILIAFAGAPRVQATRSRAEAEQLAADLLVRIKAGADFAELMKEYSDDSGGGIYTMISSGAANPAAGIMKRTGMVPAFGDTGWRLEVNEVGVAPYDKQKSPYGWHIIKRLS